MKILCLWGSTSRKSINRRLAQFAARALSQKVAGATIELLDLNDYEMPLFSVDREAEIGHPHLALQFLEKIKSADFIILSLAEHNGAYSTAFKNVLDWASRAEDKVWANKPMLLMATSPGRRGGASVLEAAKSRFPFLGANIKATFSLPEFEKNFDHEKGITQPEHIEKFQAALLSTIG